MLKMALIQKGVPISSHFTQDPGGQQPELSAQESESGGGGIYL